LDQFGVKPDNQPPTYIPPATNEIAASGPGNFGPQAPIALAQTAPLPQVNPLPPPPPQQQQVQQIIIEQQPPESRPPQIFSQVGFH